MGEPIIELQPLRQDKYNQSDSEEYHEIGHEALQEALLSPKRPVTPIKEYDFFTKYDTGSRKQSTKKRKKRKDSRPKTIKDVISLELANKSLLIENNIIRVDSEVHNGYMEQKTRIHQILKSTGSQNFDHENGLNRCQTDYNISPVFPQVLENSGSKEINIPVQYIEPTLFSDVVTDYLESGTKQSPKFFDIILKNIKFKHHHEFSLEKLYSLKLIQYYRKYDTSVNSLKELNQKIDINRRTIISLKEKLLQISPNSKEEIRFDKNVLKYTKTMLELKEKYYHTLEEQKENIHRIISLWADVESIREKCGLTKTDLFLKISENKIEQDEFEKQWNQAFEMEYSDMILKIEYNFINSYLEYKESKRQSGNVFERNKIIKPKLEIDYDKLKEDVELLVNRIVSKKNIDLLLKMDSSLKSNANESKTSFANYYCFKIYVDNVFVCESESYVCEKGQSDVHFIEYLSIEILTQNETLNIVLFENDEEVSSLQIKLSDIKKNTTQTSLKNTFVFDKIEAPSSKYIGCGYDIREIAAKNKVRLKTSNLFKGKLLTNCDVDIQFGWNNKYNDSQFESIKSHMDIGRRIKQLQLGKSEPRLNEITEIINNLYNTSIEDNQTLMISLKNLCKSRLRTDNCFNFNGNDSEFLRFKLLHLRSSGGLFDLENKSVPLFANQMSTELLCCLQKKEHKDLCYDDFKNETDNLIDVQRFIGVKFVEKLNKNVMKKVNDHLLKITHKDVVRDFEELCLRGLFANPTNLMLGAATCISRQTLIRDCLMKDQEIHVTVYKAYNLTCRSSAMITEDENDCDNIAGFKVHPLRPFVQVSYRALTAQTATAIGRHPSWNHTLKLKTRLEPLSSIHINIYDQCKEHLNETYTDDQSQSTVVYRKFNKWLGAIDIPMHTVLSLGNVRGSFKVNVPPLLFGYENSPSKQSESTFPEFNQLIKKESSFLALQVTTSLSYLGGFENYRQPITNDSEADFIIRHLNEFVTEFINDFPARNISLTFIDSTGRNKCVSEFLQAIPIPDYECFPIDPRKSESARSKSSGYSKSSSSKSSRKKSLTDDRESVSVETWKSGEIQLMKYIDAVVRYVSLIPTYEMVEPHVVTLMGAELLKVLYGSPLDHTILLASFFIHLEVKCWIIIGFALPRGLSSYVLVQYYNNKILKSNDPFKARGICGGSDGFAWYIYDAVAGERYELREIGCPLKTVSYAFDSENIWVNTQPVQDCESVSLNFSKSSEWQTVFNKPLFITRPLSESPYSKPEGVETLRVNLETKIKNKIQKWRSHIKTIWNRYCSTLLREMLPHWEYWSFNPTETRTSPGHRLKQFMATYKMFGFPLNMSYLNSKLIISRIKSTAIHVNDDPNVEFGLGVEVYAYPNNVLSVWVFLASIIRI